MRITSANISNAVSSGGPMIGENQPVTRITVDPTWYLHTTEGRQGTRPLNKLPIRWFQSQDNSQFETEMEIPNLKTVIIDRSLQSQAGTIEVVMYNNVTPPNGEAGDNPDAFGRPGYFSYARGVSPDAQRRWGQQPNAWKDQLRENALLRCVDTQTEILTRRGWLRWDEVSEGDYTLGIDPATGIAEWQIIKSVYRERCTEQLTRMRTRVHDSLTTPEHRWLVKTRAGRWAWKTTETLKSGDGIPLSAPVKLPASKTYSDDFVELAAWFFTEGSHEHRQRSLENGISISQSHTVNLPYVERIRALCQRLYGDSGVLPRGPYVSQERIDRIFECRDLGMTQRAIAEKLGENKTSVGRWLSGQRNSVKHYKWQEVVRGGSDRACTEFCFTKEVGNAVTSVIAGYDKVPTAEFLLTLTQDQLNLFIDVCIMADGCTDRGQDSFIQAHPERTSAFEMACVLAGRPIHRTTRNGVDCVTLLLVGETRPVNADLQSGGERISREDYDDVIWCPWVEHGNWLARRNGTVFYTGNCYQGYGGQEKPLGQAIYDGNVMLCGVFLVDNVVIESGGGGSGGGSGGLLTLNGRDMTKLLIDQQAWPPTVPQAFYTSAGIEYYYSGGVSATPEAVAAQNQIFEQYCKFNSCSGSTDDKPILGHVPSSCLDQNSNTYYITEGKDSPEPSDLPTILFDVGCEVSAVYLETPPNFGGFGTYIGIKENGVWQDIGGGPVPHVLLTSPNDDGGWYVLPRTYQAEQMRLTFELLVHTRYNPAYRAALSTVKTGLNGDAIVAPETNIDVVGPRDDLASNYYDYAQIVSDFLMWSGFYFKEDVPGDGYPSVFGIVEYTGAYNPLGPIPPSTFDKTPIIDCIQQIAQIVGYVFRIGERGEAFFYTPNWWSPGNFDDYSNYYDWFPVLDESVNLTDYVQTTSDQGLVSEIIVSPVDPYQFGSRPNDVTVTRLIPGNIASLRGINKPAMIGVPQNVPVTPEDQAVLAELLALQCYFTMRQGSATAVFDPSITPDTQIKIYDRVTGEANIHYVVGVHTEHDLDQGTHMATYSTYWLGDEDHWVINTNQDSLLGGSTLTTTTYNDYGVIVSEQLLTFLEKTGSARVQQLITNAKAAKSYQGTLPDTTAVNPKGTVSQTLSSPNLADVGIGQEPSLSGGVPDAGTRTEDYQYGTTLNPSVQE